MAKKKKEKKKISSRFILFFAILAVVLAIVIFSNKIGGGSFLRIFYLIGDGITGAADEATIKFDSNNANRFHPVNGGFAVLSIDGLHIYALSGEEKSFTALNYHSPTLSGGKKRLVAYDRNGQEYTVTDGDEIIKTETMEAPIINISMNEGGAYSVVTAGPECKALVTAYDGDAEKLYSLHSTEQYIISAPVSEDEDYMATLGYTASSGSFCGKVTFYALDEEGARASTDLPDCVPISARFLKNDDLMVVCEDKMLRFNDNGELVDEIPFEGMSLMSASLESDELSSVLLDNHGRGGGNRLIVSEDKDNELVYNFSESIFDISSAGDYTALLLSDRVVVYDSDGEEHHTFYLNQPVKECIMRRDGTVFVIGRNFANLLIP